METSTPKVVKVVRASQPISAQRIRKELVDTRLPVAAY